MTSGRKRETLTGNATAHLYPHFKPLLKLEGMMNYIHTEVTTRSVFEFNVLLVVVTCTCVDFIVSWTLTHKG